MSNESKQADYKNEGFVMIWKDALNNPPEKESDYLCIAKRVNYHGIAKYQRALLPFENEFGFKISYLDHYGTDYGEHIEIILYCEIPEIPANLIKERRS